VEGGIISMRRRSSLNFGRKRKKFNVRRLKEVSIWAAQILAVMLVALLFVSGFGIRSTVVGQAMADNLNSGDQVFINKVAYLISNPKSGDIIVFLPNGNEKSHYYVRRVVGVLGDRVQIKNGVLYINGALYEEVNEVASMEEAGIAEKEILLGEDEYFVLGDNRNNSEDSRYANIGNIKKKYIVGKAWLCLEYDGGIGFVH
jgi:signal peptidase I